ncbi:hypothetical protein Kpol_1014p23 [Vanderwaltozyma polyspora DSM 70294]|uniref:Sodium/calcium exchanger membrane region domain-containing protein n=1 Tax=Vanderwaltozyma polyspora (strain ATCC 22028 / DSM 70294 / BCRC 21397 / CBS 2163 / NBRC 10782 / NRRL Y-8283 / UCD 57-17) TaxID=436907 RepID=A7TNF1_VANPO|nr:uncharacterized protein Kpol_1014p23 [Vanderwaltozyma polyspora DSM 70294]EDO16204.1 hypothetical protein Kpol_1014p23 [Vanderwaltozyma polyspora DSM 70294]
MEDLENLTPDNVLSTEDIGIGYRQNGLGNKPIEYPIKRADDVKNEGLHVSTSLPNIIFDYNQEAGVESQEVVENTYFGTPSPNVCLLYDTSNIEDFNVDSHPKLAGEELVINHFHRDPNEDYLENINESFSGPDTLRRRQEIMNKVHPFAVKVWKAALYRKERSIQQMAYQDIHETEFKTNSKSVTFLNFLWSIVFGLPLFLLFIGGALIMQLLYCFSPLVVLYRDKYYSTALYLLYPFGKVVYLERNESESKPIIIIEQPSYGTITSIQDQQNNPSKLKVNYGGDLTNSTTQKFKRYKELSIFYYLHRCIFDLIIQPALIIIASILWMLVLTIPTSKILWGLRQRFKYDYLLLHYDTLDDFNRILEQSDDRSQIESLFCTFKASALNYYKYTVDGINIIVTNLLVVVLLTFVDYYILHRLLGYESGISGRTFIFVLCLLSIVTLSFYIGQAIASISTQTSMTLGAVFNAFFSSVVEVYLYCVALNYNEGLLVEGSIIGSILGAVLLLPGLSMCSGAIPRKIQRYNPSSAGITSALLIFSSIVTCMPTLTYILYGEYQIVCTSKAVRDNEKCHFVLSPPIFDDFFIHVIQPISQLSSFILFLAYITGLWFTLKTHAVLILQNQVVRHSKSNLSDVLLGPIAVDSQDASRALSKDTNSCANWSMKKSIAILLGSTVCYTLISEILIECLQSILEDFSSLNPKLLGLIVIALVPNTTEFINAISFALKGNIALSMEIGSAYVLQVCLLQIPALILFSTIKIWVNKDENIVVTQQLFPMVFPLWDIMTLLTSVIMFTYLFAEGNSNYFKGVILVLLYFLLISGFYVQNVLGQ